MPKSAPHLKSTKRLGIKELVRENHALSFQLQRVAKRSRLRAREGVFHPRHHSSGRFGSDFHKNKLTGIPFSKQVRAGGGNQLAEERTARGGGEEVGAAFASDPLPVRPVVPAARIIKGEFDKTIEGNRPARRDFGAKDGEELGGHER